MVDFTNSKQIRRQRFFRYAPLFLWIGVIFLFSTSQASMGNTSRFIRPILVFLFPGASEETLVSYHFYIRKFAHFAEYAILAFFASRAFSTSFQKFLQKYWFLISLSLVLIIASTDEFNQSFISTRTGSIWDVLLDLSGGLTMLLIVYFFKIWRNKSSH